MVQLPQVKQEKVETEIGSHFVANYPPFSVWSREHVPAAIDRLDAGPYPETPLGLYLHIPFCRKRCRFCYFRVYTDKNGSEVDIYMDALAREVDAYADRPGLAGRQFEFVYFGGGTPSFLSSQQLTRMIERINTRWTWSAAKEVTFECEPGTLKESKLQTIKDIGVTRISLGVEHFDDELLEANGRAHKSPEIFRAYDWIRQVGFPQVNIDLIAGMMGETDAKWRDAVGKAIAMKPDSVTIYQMEMPHNTVLSRESKAKGEAPPIADWPTKQRWVDEAFDRFQAEGYIVSSAYTLVKPTERSGFVYRDALWHGADLIGTGVASFSHFQGAHYQNVDGWDEYVERCGKGELPINRALPITDHQRLIREMILQLKTGRLSAGYFRTKFGQEITGVFGEAFDSLVKEKFAEIEGDEIRLTRAGLLQVDPLLKRFFESEFRGVRYT
ncbi:MAG TPA: coproporphyrinogen-III oxidase family protein [Phycisphaerae bacterium]|nr:coproporphyrinogen-III oxidase family protein [Phycisphaerae bacterium]HRW53617.1 coproporphyrinogen-III oxidase family protein [Phycisphaerae bacterium]